LSGFSYCPHCGTMLVAGEAGGVGRRVCPEAACGFVHWDNPVPVVAALVELDGRILLARNVAWPEKSFGLVTGFLERDETPEAGVAREVAEELGLATVRTTLIGLYPFAQMNQLIIAYHVVASGRIVLNEELAEIRLFAPDRLKPWGFGTGLAVRDWLAARQS
jgi:NADH pyrophosphatase NudC (nudix superfamily)